MATRNITGTIQVRRDSAANWISRNPILKAGEFGYDTTNGAVKIGDGSTPWQRLPGLMRNYVVYGVKIDRTNSNPATAVTYTDDAAGFTAATPSSAGSWADKFPFNKIRPCLLKNGTVVGYLNPNDYTHFDNGATVPVADHSVGDIMVEFPKCYYKIEQNENYTYVKISDSPILKMDGFTDWAYSYKGVVRDKFYIGAYKGTIYNSVLYSLPGYVPTREQTIGTFRAAAQARGAGYEITPYNKLVLLQVLYLIRFKSLNSQTALGNGYVSGSTAQVTGITSNKGLYYGETSSSSRVKCHGIEDFWGNILEWIDGLEQSNNRLFVSDGNFNDTASGYEDMGIESSVSVSGYIKSICGNNKLGFLIADGSGSTTTYYSDYGSCGRSAGVCVPYFGGYWVAGSGAGAFYLILSYAPSVSRSDVGARLCFCG